MIKKIVTLRKTEFEVAPQAVGLLDNWTPCAHIRTTWQNGHKVGIVDLHNGETIEVVDVVEVYHTREVE